MLTESALREVFASGVLTEQTADEVMLTIASWLNDMATHDLGREFLIRVLAIQSELPSYHIELLNDLIRSAGLLPYAKAAVTLEDAILREAHAVPSLEKDSVFHSLQLQVFRLLMSRRNVVLSATTSVGKSMIIDAIVASGRFRKIVVIVPTIALIDETRRRISKRFGSSHAIITHPTQKAENGLPIVYVLTQERVLSRDDLTDVEFFVVDEFYKLDIQGLDARAVDLNLAFHRLASAGAQFYLIGPHVNQVRGIAAAFQHVFIPSTFSTVALDVVHYNLPQHGRERVSKLLELAANIETPTLIYCQSPSKCGEVAAEMIASGNFGISTETSDAVDWLQSEFPPEWVVIEALKHGIGIHHGNVPRAIQHYMVKCFSEGTIRFLICTSTIIEGVNTVAENVIVYDRRIKTSNIDYFTFRNIAGRAGRMGQWFVGKVFVLEAPPEAENVTVDLPIEQQDENTPLSLILDLPQNDLSQGSKERIDNAVEEALLSYETLQANRQIPIFAQRAIAERIRSDLLYRQTLNWKGMPNGRELSTACELIYDYIDEGRSLKGYQIFNGEQLAAVLIKLSTMTSLKSFIADRVVHRRTEQSVSDAVDVSLRFLRSYVVYTFPRQLNAVQNIFNDVSARLGSSLVADYSLYAAKAESLYMDTGLFALDEYGVPPQTARRLGARYEGIDILSDALELVGRLDLENEGLHPFEISLLRELQGSIGGEATTSIT